MREDGGGNVLLVEERLGVKDVEGVAVGELHAGEGSLLREDLVNVGVEKGVGREEGLAQAALDGGFELLLGRRGDSVWVDLWLAGSGGA